MIQIPYTTSTHQAAVQPECSVLYHLEAKTWDDNYHRASNKQRIPTMPKLKRSHYLLVANNKAEQVLDQMVADIRSDKDAHLKKGNKFISLGHVLPQLQCCTIPVHTLNLSVLLRENR